MAERPGEFIPPKEHAKPLPCVQIVPKMVDGKLDRFSAKTIHQLSAFPIGIMTPEAAETSHPDLNILVDPNEIGREVTRLIRIFPNSPLLVVSSSTDWESEAKALNSGANAYLSPRPEGSIHRGLLRAHVDSLLRQKLNRPQREVREFVSLEQPIKGVEDEDPERKTLVVGDLEIALEKRTVKKGGHLVRISNYEWKMLCILSKYADEIVSHHELSLAIYNSGPQGYSLRELASRLRGKIDPEGTLGLIKNFWGRGYMLVTNPTDNQSSI